MPSQYLTGSDLATFGAPNATTAQVAQASVLIDAYLNRPAGLVYTADPAGRPVYMSALTPELTLTTTAAVGPGNGVTVGVSGPLEMLQVGDCVVMDRANASLMEAVQVTSMNLTARTVTLGSTAVGSLNGLINAHASGCTLEKGLLLTEKLYAPKGRSEVMLGFTPVARVIGGTGRYGYGRRADAANYGMDNFNLLASLSKFGGPPAWEIWPANTAAGIDAATGQLWVPAGIMLAYYSEVKVRYVAGYAQAALPAEIKLACAQVIQSAANNPTLGNVKSFKAGDTAITQFAASVMTDDTMTMIAPWRARAFA